MFKAEIVSKIKDSKAVVLADLESIERALTC